MGGLQSPLSNLQLELLKLYASGVPDEYLPELKNRIAKFLLEKAREEADKVWDKKGYTKETVDKWLKED